MSGHSRWETVQRHADPQLHNVQLAYVDGYLLALEDVMDDMRAIATLALGLAPREQLLQIKRKILQTQRSALLTKKKLLERGTVTFVCDPCKDGKHPDCPGDSWCDCAHRTVSREPGT